MHIHHSAHPVPSISHTILLLLPHPISSPLTYSLISLTLHVKQSHQTLLLHSLIPLTLFSHPSHLIISNLLSFNPTLTPYSPNNLASLYHPTLILLSYYSYFTLFPISLHSLAQHPFSSHSFTPLSVSHPTLPLSHSTLAHSTLIPLSLFLPTLSPAPLFTTLSHSTSTLYPLLPNSHPCNPLSPLFQSHSTLFPTLTLFFPLSPLYFTPLSLLHPTFTALSPSHPTLFFDFPSLSPLLYSCSLPFLVHSHPIFPLHSSSLTYLLTSTSLFIQLYLTLCSFLNIFFVKTESQDKQMYCAVVKCSKMFH